MWTLVGSTNGLSAMSKNHSQSKVAKNFAHDDTHASCGCQYHAEASRLHMK